ncbi:PH domain-containing protein [Salinicoccus sesuvii]|uniref:PH domain-containing protein n=1 Tax=Salinicoccus sesuvii TaxID=868281 RepID=A0ABV7N2Y1_9STAP
MHSKLKSLGDVELRGNEVIGPELVGTIEYEKNGCHSFYGAIIPTTERIFVNIRSEDGIDRHPVEYKDITGISTENLLMVGNIIHIWIGREIKISMKSVSDGKLDKFLSFLYKYRSRQLRLDSDATMKSTQKAG